MPELPEVETVVRDLRPLLAGRTILAARQSKQKLRRPWDPAWNAQTAGSGVAGVRRRGKWILIDLLPGPSPTSPPGNEGLQSHRDVVSPPGPASPQLCHVPVPPLPPGEGGGEGGPAPVLRIHLGMTGQFTVADAGAPEPDHLHVVFSLDNGCELRLRDPRRFGSAEYFPDRAALEAEMNTELGPEPFGLGADYFRAAVRGTGRTLKALLLDQKVVAGVGNIYADEACFRAKLYPGRPGKQLAGAECDRLREAVEAVLARAVESRGSTIRDYVGGSGLRGGFQNEFSVYGRTGEPCRTCGAAIRCARYAGRASHFCPTCQPVEGKKPGAGGRKNTSGPSAPAGPASHG